MDINALREFIAVSRLGSFSAASRSLNVPKSTVSKRVQDLEAALGARLIERSTRQLRLTAEGSAVLARAERIIDDADDLVREVTDQGGALHGTLRIATPELFGQVFAGSIAAAYRLAHPGVSLEVVMADRLPDLIGEGFDAAITVGPLPDSAMISRQFAQATSVLVAAPGVKVSEIKTPQDIGKAPCIRFSKSNLAWRFVKEDQAQEATPPDGLSLSSLLAIRDAALAGGGFAYLPEFLVSDALESGSLIRVLPDWEGFTLPLNIIYPTPQSMTRRLRGFIDCLVGAFPSRLVSIADR